MDINSIYTKTVTIINRKFGKDTVDHLDLWKKTVLSGVAYYDKSNKIISNNDIQIVKSSIVLIPFGKGYSSYPIWKSNMTGFTVSENDYISFDTVDDVLTNENIVAVMNNHLCCRVKSFESFEDRDGNYIQLKIEGS